MSLSAHKANFILRLDGYHDFSWFDETVPETKDYTEFYREVCITLVMEQFGDVLHALNTPTWIFKQTAKDNRSSTIKKSRRGFVRYSEMPSEYFVRTLSPILLTYSKECVFDPAELCGSVLLDCVLTGEKF